jgi:uncharacterized protein YkwD
MCRIAPHLPWTAKRPAPQAAPHNARLGNLHRRRRSPEPGRSKRALPAFALTFTAVAAFASLPVQAQEIPLDVPTLKAAVFAATNAYRASKNLPQVRQNAALDAAAAAYATYLASHEAAGHTADGATPAKRVFAQGYKWCFVSENVWSSFRRAQTILADEVAAKAMEGWKNSPGHNANLLEKRAHDIGIGAAAWKKEDGSDIFRVVQVFGDECPGKARPTQSIGDMIGGALDAFR